MGGGGRGRGKGGAKERKRVREGERRNWCDTVNSCSLMELYLEIRSWCPASQTLSIYTGFSVVLYTGQDAFQLGSHYNLGIWDFTLSLWIVVPYLKDGNVWMLVSEDISLTFNLSLNTTSVALVALVTLFAPFLFLLYSFQIDDQKSLQYSSLYNGITTLGMFLSIPFLAISNILFILIFLNRELNFSLNYSNQLCHLFERW